MLNSRGVAAKAMLGFPSGSLVIMNKEKKGTKFLVKENITSKESNKVFKWFIPVLLGLSTCTLCHA